MRTSLFDFEVDEQGRSKEGRANGRRETAPGEDLSAKRVPKNELFLITLGQSPGRVKKGC